MNKRLTLFLLLGLAVAAAVGYLMYRRLFRIANDEAPIIVKNGSMTAEVKRGTWVDENTHWRHQSDNTNGNTLWVQIERTTDSCPIVEGARVQIEHSQGGLTTFHPNVNGTFLTPKNDFSKDQGVERLRRGSQGYITAVHVPGAPSQPCPFTQNNLRAICIWTTSAIDSSQCQ